MMLDSLSFLHSSPPVFSSMNTVNPSFLFSKIYNQKDTKPVKKRRGNRSWAQWAILARPTIFFPLLLGWGQFLSFLILMILRRLDRLQFKPELPFSSDFLEKFSTRVQIRTPHSTFLFILFENFFKPRQRRLAVYMLLTSSVISTTSKQCFEQPTASFLVCSLIFIEY